MAPWQDQQNRFFHPPYHYLGTALSPQNPTKVVIDEAVEVAKEFGAESSSSFVNGVLGSIVKNLKIKNQEKNKKDHDYQS